MFHSRGPGLRSGSGSGSGFGAGLRSGSWSNCGGACTGGGLGIAGVCDLRIAAAREELSRLAAADGFTLLRKEDLPALGEDDFSDWVHANARGRERLTAFLADYLARTL